MSTTAKMLRAIGVAVAIVTGIGPAGLVLPAAAAAGTPRTGPPPDTLTSTYTVAGVHVVQRLTPANDIVAVNLYLDGGVQQLSASTAGIEELALRASVYGTTRYPGLASRTAFGRTGSQWVLDPGTDWTMTGFRGVTDQFDSAWAVFADRIVHPTLDSASVALVRDRMIREARLQSLDPERAAFLLADSLAFEGHPYSLSPAGTESSLSSLSADIVRRYVSDEFVTSRMLVVVVGNIPRARLEPLIAATLGTLPPGSYRWTIPPGVPRRPSSLTFVPRLIHTNYIVGYFAGPPVTSRDYAAFRIATAILSSRLASAIRYNADLSYSAGAPYRDRAVASGGFYASTNSPMLVMALMRQQLDSMKKAQYDNYGLNQFETGFRSDYLIENETNESQAGLLGRAQLLEGDYRRASTELDALEHVTPLEVERATKTYMRDIQFVYVGDTTRVRRDWMKSM
ncbi:MAG: M16 family metallopeptidase [Gemmatimonadales bacterium]